MSIVLDGSNATTSGLINAGTVNAGGANPFNNTLSSILFTGIPSTAKRVTVMFNGVGTSGTSNWQLQIGSGSVVTTGYNSSYLVANSTFAGNGSTNTTGFLFYNAAGSDTAYGHVVLTSLGSNNWVLSSLLSAPNVSARTTWGAGGISLSGALDRVNITTLNGTDTFARGSINIFWE